MTQFTRQCTRRSEKLHPRSAFVGLVELNWLSVDKQTNTAALDCLATPGGAKMNALSKKAEFKRAYVHTRSERRFFGRRRPEVDKQEKEVPHVADLRLRHNM